MRNEQANTALKKKVGQLNMQMIKPYCTPNSPPTEAVKWHCVCKSYFGVVPEMQIVTLCPAVLYVLTTQRHGVKLHRATLQCLIASLNALKKKNKGKIMIKDSI